MSNNSSASGRAPQERRKVSTRHAPSFPSRKGAKLVDGMSRAELVLHFGPKVRRVASQIAQTLPHSVEVDDLMSVGFMGLMDAADKFDPSQGTKFTTYAEFRIRGAILDELRAQDWLPRRVRRKVKSNQIAPLTLVNYGSTDEISDLVKSGPESDPYTQTSHHNTQAIIGEAVSQLTTEERLVVTCYYYRGLNQREIGEIMELTESRVSQIHAAAIFKLKEALQRRVSNTDTIFFLLLDLA